MRSRLIFLPIGLVVGSLLTCAAVWANVFRAHVDTDGNSIGRPVNDVASGALHTVQIAGLCLQGADRAKITDVRPTGVLGEVQITNFTLTPMQAIGNSRAVSLDDYVEDLDEFYAGPPTRRLSTQCSEGYDHRGLVVELKAPSRSELPVAASGFAVDYEVRGMSKSVDVRTTFAFCADDERDDHLLELNDEDGAPFDFLCEA
ncbi:MAG: hypothetical protein ABWZ99_02825 [Ilumatobacteraceae bacterium]